MSMKEEKQTENKQNTTDFGMFKQIVNAWKVYFKQLKIKCNSKDEIKNEVVQIFFPDDCNCIVCGKEIAKGSKYGLCEKCLQEMPFNNQHFCRRCGSPMENEAYFCLECQNNNKFFDFARSSLVYENQVQRLILNAKFHNNRWVQKYFAEMLCDTYNQCKMKVDFIVPTPISNERLQERGYNQAELIAKPLAKLLGLECKSDIVIKTKDNKRQSELSIKERRENVKGVYSIKNRYQVKGKRILVVDDILTTGSTLSEIARKLKSAGASEVYGLVVASPRYKLPVAKEENLQDYLIVD